MRRRLLQLLVVLIAVGAVVEVGTAQNYLVVAASAQDTTIDGYLAAGGVQPDRVVTVEAGALPLAGTPTLFLVDRGGVITNVWAGQLDDEQETTVMEALFEV